MMRDQTAKTTKESSITDGNALPSTEHKPMRVIDFTQAKTPAETEELFSEARRVWRGVLDRKQAELAAKRQHR